MKDEIESDMGWLTLGWSRREWRVMNELWKILEVGDIGFVNDDDMSV